MTDTPRQPLQMYSLVELFTPEQIEKAATIVKHYKSSEARRPLNDLLVERVVNDAMPHINQVTGQENNAQYMGYLLEYVLGTAPNQVPSSKVQKEQTP